MSDIPSSSSSGSVVAGASRGTPEPTDWRQFIPHIQVKATHQTNIGIKRNQFGLFIYVIIISELIIFADALVVSQMGPSDNIAKCVKLSIYNIHGLSSSGKQICCASTLID